LALKEFNNNRQQKLRKETAKKNCSTTAEKRSTKATMRKERGVKFSV
jgi:hypothetical protein